MSELESGAGFETSSSCGSRFISKSVSEVNEGGGSGGEDGGEGLAGTM